jgi:hypothetical protein
MKIIGCDYHPSFQQMVGENHRNDFRKARAFWVET